MEWDLEPLGGVENGRTERRAPRSRGFRDGVEELASRNCEKGMSEHGRELQTSRSAVLHRQSEDKGPGGAL